jgi:alkylation response protein AidB-like acyl-CoA dehydrogenase
LHRRGFRPIPCPFHPGWWNDWYRDIQKFPRGNFLIGKFLLDIREQRPHVLAVVSPHPQCGFGTLWHRLERQVISRLARHKDEGKRCDIEAGLAKLLGARVAWSNADLNVQIHGGNGYALEHEASRILCDARILNIFEGVAEIQADVIGRGLASPRG